MVNRQVSKNISVHTENSPTGHWYMSMWLPLFLNILAGIGVAIIQTVAKSPSQLFIGGILLLGLGGFLPWIIRLKIKASHLMQENVELRRQINEDLAQLDECKLRYATQLHSLGILDIADALGTSEWSPDAVMRRAQNEVKFVGVFGHKWVLDHDRKEMFRKMLTRIQLNGGRVSFLLLDPCSDAAKRLAEYRKQDPEFYRDFASIEFFKGLMVEFDCFQLRVFEHFPFIRLIFVDGRCSISRFKVASAADETLRAPQLVFSPSAPSDNWTMYQPFMLLFDYLWNHAVMPTVTVSQSIGQPNAASPPLGP